MTRKMKSSNFLAVALLAAVTEIPAATSQAQATAPAAAQPSAPATAQPSAPATAPSAAQPPAAPAITKLAATDLVKKIYLQLASGTVTRSLLTPEESKALSPETIAKLAPQLKAFGDPVSFTMIGGTRIHGGINYKFAVKFPDQQHQIAMYVDPSGLVGGYSIRP